MAGFGLQRLLTKRIAIQRLVVAIASMELMIAGVALAAIRPPTHNAPPMAAQMLEHFEQHSSDGSIPRFWSPEAKPLDPFVIPTDSQQAHDFVAGNERLDANIALHYEGIKDIRGYGTLAPRRMDALIMRLPRWSPKLLRLLGVGYVLASKPPSTGFLVELGTITPTGVTLWKLRGDSPRAYLVRQVIAASGEQDSLAKVLASAFEPHTMIVVEGAAPPPTLPGPSQDHIEGVRWLETGNSTIALEVETAAPAYLVVADTYAEGWSATVNDQPTPILLANHAQRAVFVPAGSSRVVMRYSPPGMWLGFGLAVLGAIVALALWLTSPRAAKSERPPQR